MGQSVRVVAMDPVARHVCGGDDPLGLLDGDDVGQALHAWGLDEPRGDPGLAQDVLVVELQAVQIELDRTPRVRGHQLGEIVDQLRLGEIIDSTLEMFADAPDRARVRLDRLGLQTLELEVLQMSLVLPVEVCRRCCVHDCPHEVV